MRRSLILFVTTSFCALSAVAPATAAHVSADNTPRRLNLAKDRGAANPAQVINIIVRLKMADADGFDKTLESLYDRNSPSFHHWLGDADLAHFAPPAAQTASVRAALESQGLTVVAGDANGFSLRATGALGDVARAFNTDIHNFEFNGKTFRANTRNAALSGQAASYVSAVAGLESQVVRPMLVRANDPKTKQPYASVLLEDVKTRGGLDKLITDQSLGAKQTFNYTTPGQALPTATYAGIIYEPDATRFPDFTTTALQKVYGLPAAYKQGLDGTGQTIVLVEAYGYPNMLEDANAFNTLNNLPQLTKANLQVVYPEGVPSDPNLGIKTGWDGEIALDVQWAHGMAPGAKIIVVATNGQDIPDFQASMQYVIDNHLGYAVSNSWEVDLDLFAGPSEQESFDEILSLAAAKGISFQFSTGDSGDSFILSPLGAPGVPSVSPHATAVGGTAIVNKIGGQGFQMLGWGDVLAPIDNVFGPFDPPFEIFLFGSGGGESVFWPKPTWQSALPGFGRQTPDISALADPYTGVPTVLTIGKRQRILVGNGGTSLSSPIFTAIWAIAQQKAGQPLGQAAPTIAALAGGITDVLPLSSPDNIDGSVTDANGTIAYPAKFLFHNYRPKRAKQHFIAPIWDQPQYQDAVSLALSLDTSLSVTKGWDNVTGYGTPEGLSFINAAAAFGTK